MLEAFRLTSLSCIIETKSRSSSLALGWSLLSRYGVSEGLEKRLLHTAELKSRLKEIILVFHSKHHLKVMLGIDDLKFAKIAYDADQRRRQKAGMAIWNRWYTNMTSSAFQLLIRNKNQKQRRLKAMLKAFELAMNGQKRDCLYSLIQNSKERQNSGKSVSQRVADSLSKLVRTQRSKLNRALKKLQNNLLEDKLDFEKKEKQRLAYAMPDMEDINSKHQTELTEAMKQAKKVSLFRRLEYSQFLRKKIAFEKLSKRESVKAVMDPRLAKRWVFETLALKYKVKKLDAFQVLRYPTIKRHEQQKASALLSDTIDRSLYYKKKAAFNKLLSSDKNFQNRALPLLERLDRHLEEKLRLSFYSLLSGKSSLKDTFQKPEKLFAISQLSKRILSKQKTYDFDLKRACFVKLCAELDPETLNGQKFNQLVYNIDLAMEKRLKLEAESHPKIVAKINAITKAAELRKKIAEGTAEKAIFEKDLSKFRESTRSLQFKKEIETRELVSRRNLGFSYGAELKRIFGELWGSNKQSRADLHSLSHANETQFEHTNRTVDFDQSVSKNVELEESVREGMLDQFREHSKNVESDYPIAIGSLKSPSNFKLNASEKVLHEKEGKRIVKRLKELNLESLVESQAFGLEEILDQLNATKTELEGSLERIVSDYNQLQAKVVEEADKIETAQMALDTQQQAKIKSEMSLIDYQDRKGILALEKTKLSQRNTQIWEETDAIQRQMNDLKNNPNSDSQEVDKLRSEYLTKQQLSQSNSSEMLKIDQELLDINRIISNLNEKKAIQVANCSKLEEVQNRMKQAQKQSIERITELRIQINELVRQIASDASVIESLEMRRRGIGNSNFDQSNANNQSGLEILGKFKEGYLKINELRLQKAKNTIHQNDIRKELNDVQTTLDELNDKIAEANTHSMNDPSISNQISELNIKRKQVTANQERLFQRLKSLSDDKADYQKEIVVNAEKLKEFTAVDVSPEAEEEQLNGSANDHSQSPNSPTDFLSKASAYLSTKADFATTDLVESSTLRENLLNLSKSSLADDNIRAILASKLNPEVKGLMGVSETNPMGTAAFDEVLAYVVERKRTYLQNHQLAFLSFLKKDEIDDRIKSNSCEILDLKEKILAKEIAIREWRRLLREMNAKRQDADRVVHQSMRRRERTVNASPVQLSTVNTQTAIDFTMYGLQFKTDTNDLLLPKKRGVGFEINTILDSSILPKLRTRVIQKIEPLIQKRKMQGSNFIDLEEKDIFSDRNNQLINADGINFDVNDSGVRDSLILDEYFPKETTKKSIRRMNLVRKSFNYLAPIVSQDLSELHNVNRKTGIVEALLRPPVKRMVDISPSAKILTNENFVSNKVKAAQILAKVIPRAMRNANNLNFYHLKLIASNSRLQSMMRALNKFRLQHLQGKLGAMRGRLGNQSAEALAEAVAAVALSRKRQAFKKISMKLNEVNRYRNWLLSKWMTKGDTNMRKHLRLVLQYWKHIKNDNLWNAKILKTMAIKAPLKSQIALWRLMLFKKRSYSCPPRFVKGLLSLINVIDSKQLRRGLRAIQGTKRPQNEFDPTFVPERKKVDNTLLQSEMITKDYVDEDFGVKSQRLYSFFTYMGIIQKRNIMRIFYRFIEQVMAEPVQARLLRYEPKALEPADQSDSGIRAVRFLLDQQIKSKNELDNKSTEIESLKEELNEKTENLYFMQVFLLNLALRRVERITKRVFNRNAELSRFKFVEALKMKN